MIVTRKSTAMLAIAALFAGLNLLDLRPPEDTTSALPALPLLDVATVTKLTIGDQINLLTIERASAEAPWQIVAPLKYPADEAVVKAFVKALSAGVPMDTQVDEGHLEDYGVDDQHALRAELYTGGDTPALAFIVGKTAGPDSAFVRLPDSDVVYRAAVGSRSRFERSAGDWRDKGALTLEREDVRDFTLVRGAENLHFVRGASPGNDDKGAPLPGEWALDNATSPIDTESVELLIYTLSRIRAGEIHAAGYDAGLAEPAAVATLKLADGATHRVVLGTKADERAAWIQVDERPEVFRVASKIRAALLTPVADLRDRRLSHFDRLAIDTATWVEGNITTTVHWDADVPKWVVVQPENTAIDQRSIAAATGSLAQLRAAAFAPDATFTPSGTSARLVMRDGTRWQLDLAAPEAEGQLVRAKVSGRAELFLIDARLVAQLRTAFGR